jgi:hypothetical protein
MSKAARRRISRPANWKHRHSGIEGKDSAEGKQTSRMFWVVPNFSAVSANTQLPPLSVKEKFVLATQG